MCLQGSPCLPGRNDVNGHNGLPGRDGRDGTKGEKGVVDPPGLRGVKGEAGPSGQDAEHRNWKQCGCRQIDDDRDIGLFKVFFFITNQESVNVSLMHKFNQSESIENDGRHIAFFSPQSLCGHSPT